MLGFLFSRAGAAMVGIVVGLGLLTWSHTHAYRAGKAAERTDILDRSIEILRERNATDDEIRNMDDAALCAALGGLPDECAGLGL
jgi:uncharacterized membrane protein